MKNDEFIIIMSGNAANGNIYILV